MSEHRKLLPGPLVIASHNPGKLREIRELLLPFGIEPVSATTLGLPEPEETGETFGENAELKAHAAATASGMPALADDSGLAVYALDGRPGVYSARWAGAEKDFGVAMALVHEKLVAQESLEPWDAQFICALSLAWPDGHVETFRGRVNGHLVWPPRGDRGFGYDAMFVPQETDEDLTFGEMAPEAKHAISHRAKAFALLVAACLET